MVQYLHSTIFILQLNCVLFACVYAKFTFYNIYITTGGNGTVKELYEDNLHSTIFILQLINLT